MRQTERAAGRDQRARMRHARAGAHAVGSFAVPDAGRDGEWTYRTVPTQADVASRRIEQRGAALLSSWRQATQRRCTIDEHQLLRWARQLTTEWDLHLAQAQAPQIRDQLRSDVHPNPRVGERRLEQLRHRRDFQLDEAFQPQNLFQLGGKAQPSARNAKARRVAGLGSLAGLDLHGRADLHAWRRLGRRRLRPWLDDDPLQEGERDDHWLCILLYSSRVRQRLAGSISASALPAGRMRLSGATLTRSNIASCGLKTSTESSSSEVASRLSGWKRRPPVMSTLPSASSDCWWP